MSTDNERRVLATFDAFLEYVRAGGATGPKSIGTGGFSDDHTDPTLNADRLGLDPASAPRRSNSKRDPFGDDEATVVGSMAMSVNEAALQAALAGAARRPSRPPVEPEQSIIVDDEALAPERPVTSADEGGGARGEVFVREMATLIKYGHAGQVPGELARFVRAHGDDLDAQFRVAEFEYARVDAERGLERLFQLASWSLDAGDVSLARRVLERAGRAAPHDLRVVALRDRIRGR